MYVRDAKMNHTPDLLQSSLTGSLLDDNDPYPYFTDSLLDDNDPYESIFDPYFTDSLLEDNTPHFTDSLLEDITPYTTNAEKYEEKKKCMLLTETTLGKLINLVNIRRPAKSWKDITSEFNLANSENLSEMQIRGIVERERKKVKNGNKEVRINIDNLARDDKLNKDDRIKLVNLAREAYKKSTSKPKKIKWNEVHKQFSNDYPHITKEKMMEMYYNILKARQRNMPELTIDQFNNFNFNVQRLLYENDGWGEQTTDLWTSIAEKCDFLQLKTGFCNFEVEYDYKHIWNTRGWSISQDILLVKAMSSCYQEQKTICWYLVHELVATNKTADKCKERWLVLCNHQETINLFLEIANEDVNKIFNSLRTQCF